MVWHHLFLACWLQVWQTEQHVGGRLGYRWSPSSSPVLDISALGHVRRGIAVVMSAIGCCVHGSQQ